MNEALASEQNLRMEGYNNQNKCTSVQYLLKISKIYDKQCTEMINRDSISNSAVPSHFEA